MASPSYVSNDPANVHEVPKMPTAIFSPNDVELFAAANKKRVLGEKQRLLQEWASDALVDAILNPYSVSRVNRDGEVPIDQIKAELASGNTTVLVWTAKHAIFKKHSSLPGLDCRDELYEGLVERGWVAYDEDDRRRPLTVADAAEWSRVYEYLSDRRPVSRGSVSILAVLKHTDFLDLLASRFGDKFTCTWTMEQNGEETQYWTPYVIKVFLNFWPKGVKLQNAAAIAKAKADFDKRSETMIVNTCQVCRKGLTRNTIIVSRCGSSSSPCNCREHSGGFCSDKCMGPWFHRE